MQIFKQIISDIPHAELQSLQRLIDSLEYGGGKKDVLDLMKKLRKQYPLIEVYLPPDYDDTRRQEAQVNKIKYNTWAVKTETFKEDMALLSEFFQKNKFYPGAAPCPLWVDEEPIYFEPIVRKVDLGCLDKNFDRLTSGSNMQIS